MITTFCNHIRSSQYCSLVEHSVLCPFVCRKKTYNNIIDFVFYDKCDCPHYEARPLTIDERLSKLEQGMHCIQEILKHGGLD